LPAFCSGESEANFVVRAKVSGTIGPFNGSAWEYRSVPAKQAVWDPSDAYPKSLPSFLDGKVDLILVDSLK